MLAVRQEDWWNYTAPSALENTILGAAWYTTVEIVFWLYNRLLLWPLATLYFNGPSFYQWGFWGGAEAADICAQLTSASADFWQRNPDACTEIIYKRLQAFVIGVQALLYMWMIYKMGSFLVRLFYWKCLARHIGPTWTWRLTPPRIYPAHESAGSK